MPNVQFVNAWFLTSIASAIVGLITLSGSALAPAVQYPGVRGVPPRAGGFIMGETGFFTARLPAAISKSSSSGFESDLR
jgi:hypothetical protein